MSFEVPFGVPLRVAFALEVVWMLDEFFATRLHLPLALFFLLA